MSNKLYIFILILFLNIQFSLTVNAYDYTEDYVYPDNFQTMDQVYDKIDTNYQLYYHLGYFTKLTKEHDSPLPKRYSRKSGLTYYPTDTTADCKGDFSFATITPPPGSATTRSYAHTEDFEFLSEALSTMDMKCLAPFTKMYNTKYKLVFQVLLYCPGSAAFTISVGTDAEFGGDEVQMIAGTVSGYKLFSADILINNAAGSMKFGPSALNVGPDAGPLYIRYTSNTEIYILNFRVSLVDAASKPTDRFPTALDRSKNGLNTCTEDDDCILGSTCSGGVCTLCYELCAKCRYGVNNMNSRYECDSCTALTDRGEFSGGECPVNYVDLTQFQDVSAHFEPNDEEANERYTMGFWIFFSDITTAKASGKDSLYHVVLKDRIVITLLPQTDTVQAFCQALPDLHNVESAETLADYDKEKGAAYNVDITSASAAQLAQMEKKDLNGRWFHVSCAVSLDHKEMYIKSMINGNKQYVQKSIPTDFSLFSQGGATVSNEILHRHIINKGDKMFIHLKNFRNSESKIYMRNLVLIKEYLPSKMDWEYYDYAKDIAANSKIYLPNYLLLYQLPLNYLYYNTVAEEYRIKGVNELYESVDIFLKKRATTVYFEPPANFKQFALTTPNKYFQDVSLNPSKLKDISPNDVKIRWMYSKNMPFICSEGYYLDNREHVCRDTCIKDADNRYIPFPGLRKSGFCDYECDAKTRCKVDSVQNAAIDLDANGEFCLQADKTKCRADGDYNLFFQCKEPSEDFHLQYSGFYNSGQIYIDLKDRDLKSYMVDFWFYPAYYLGFEAMNPNARNYVFYSSVFWMYFKDAKDKDLYFGYVSDRKSTDEVGKLNYVLHEWNHVVIQVLYERTTRLYHKDIYLNDGHAFNAFDCSDEECGKIRFINFCHSTCNHVYHDLIQPIFWTTAYYRDLKIWRAETTTITNTIIFDRVYAASPTLPGSMLYHFPLRNEYIGNNKITSIDCNENLAVESGFHRLKRYNYASKFDYIYAAGLTGRYVEDYDDTGATIKSCEANCARCWPCTEDANKIIYCRCFKCDPGFYLTNWNKCEPIGTTFFKSPPKNIIDYTVIEVKDVLPDILNWRKTTITFWVKLFALYGDVVSLAKYSIDKNLEILFDANRESEHFGINLKYKEDYFVTDDQFRLQFGHWTFFSLSYHKALPAHNVYFPAMLKFEINQKSYQIDRRLFDKRIGLDLDLSRFYIPVSIYGLYYRLRYYNDFIINSFGVDINQNIRKDATVFLNGIPGPGPDGYTFLNSGTDEHNCVKQEYLKTPLDDFECMHDGEVPSANSISSKYNYRTFDRGGLSGEDGCNGGCLSGCIGKTKSSCTCLNVNENTQVLLDAGGLAYCQEAKYLNFAKAKATSNLKIKSSNNSLKYTLQFWVYVYNYVNGKFGGLSVHWNGHARIVLEDCRAEIDQSGEERSFCSYHCYPYQTETDNVYEPAQPKSPAHKIEINQWVFLSCAVDYTIAYYYLNTNDHTNGLHLSKHNLGSTTPTDIARSNQMTTLKLNDNSDDKDDWGVIFYKQIRLWSDCYINAEYLSYVDFKDKINKFPTLLHVFHPVYQKPNANKIYNVVERQKGQAIITFYNTGTYGMNVIIDYKYEEVKLVNDNGAYWERGAKQAVEFVDISRFKEDQIEVKDVYRSYSGAYSMAFWILLEDANDLKKGLHFYWEKMMQITVIKRERLQAYCFPQGYFFDYSTNHFAKDFEDIVNGAENKAYAVLVDAQTPESGTWIWVMCSVSLYNRRFYVLGNDKNVYKETPIQGESLYTSSTTGLVRSAFPIKYFHAEITGTSGAVKKSSLVIKGTQREKKIYLRMLHLFRDYIPNWFNLEYMRLDELAANQMNSLLLVCNFSGQKSEKMRWLCYQFQPSGTQKYDKQNIYTEYLNVRDDMKTFELSPNFVVLDICSMDSTNKMKYDHNKKTCVNIESCELNRLNCLKCMDEDTPITCMEHYYLTRNIDGHIVCEGGCEPGSVRHPMVSANTGLCSAYCMGEDVATCPSNSNAEQKDFVKNYKCGNNMVRITYDCIDNMKVPNSAMFFGRCYNNPNAEVKIKANIQTQMNTGYYYEVWFRKDHVLNKWCDMPNEEYYMHSYPFYLSYKRNEKKYYFQIYGHTNTKEVIEGFNEYEWNKVVIKVDMLTAQQIVEVYVNFHKTPRYVKKNLPASKLKLNLGYISYCSKAGTDPHTNGACSYRPQAVNWGSAYYRNLKVWELNSTSMQIIEDMGLGIHKERTKNLLLFYPLTIDYLDNNRFTEIVQGLDIVPTHTATYGLDDVDQYNMYNYATNFDWNSQSTQNDGQYIEAMDDLVIRSSRCYGNCLRCYSEAEGDCYECKEGYVLEGKLCRQITGYFLKTPLTGSEIQFNVKGANFDLTHETCFTLCFYIKFIGVRVESIVDWPFIMKFSEYTYLAVDYKTTNLIFIIENTKAFEDSNFRKYLGMWIPICVANYISGTEFTKVYPNMVTLSVNKQDIPFVKDYKLPATGMKVEKLTLGYDIVALYGDLRVYKKFIQGAPGKVASKLREEDLLFQYDLYGGSNIYCVQQVQLTSTQANELTCVANYNVYLDATKRCNDDTLYFEKDVADSNLACPSCDTGVCKTFCFQGDKRDCTCDMNDALYWLRVHDVTRKTFCEYIPNIDYSVLKDVSINVPSSSTKESTLEFWIYIYSYNKEDVNFQEINVEWNLHNRVTFKNANNKLYATCYALFDESDPAKYPEFIDSELAFFRWQYIKCGTKYLNLKNYHKFFFNEQEENLQTVDFPVRNGKTTLKIKNYNGLNPAPKNNYGFVFIRDIKIWQQYNIQFDARYINLSSFGIYNKIKRYSELGLPGLISYIRGDFSKDDYLQVRDEHVYKIKNEHGIDNDEDEVEYYMTWRAVRKSEFIGYNIVYSDYYDLVTCPEGLVYNSATETCVQIDNSKCLVPSDVGDNCLTCPDDKKFYFVSENKCLEECPERTYPRVDMNQCRECHFSCYTCTDEFENSCTSCDDDPDTGESRYYVPEAHICALICQDYGLTASVLKPHLCVLFEAGAELVNIQENYPYNKPDLSEIVAKITYCSVNDYTLWWGFDFDLTRAANNDPEMVFPNDEGPWLKENVPPNYRETLDLKIDTDFLEDGRTYVLYLEVISTKDGVSVKDRINFYIKVNAPPYGGTLKVVPEIGIYDTTEFYIMCHGWQDDTTPTADLVYEFSYVEEDIPGVNTIRAYDLENQMSRKFRTKFFDKPKSKVIITCKIKDQYDAITTVTTDIYVANDINGGIFSLNKTFDNYFIPGLDEGKDLLYRSKFLLSIAEDPYKLFRPDIVQTEYEPSVDQNMVTKTDPMCSEDFCNNNGECLLIDDWIACYCQRGYVGKFCHVDPNGYVVMEAKYHELFTKLLTELGNTITDDYFFVFYNLFKGARLFVQDREYFTNNFKTYLTFAKNTYKNNIVKFKDEYFDLLSFYHDFTMTEMNSQKAKIKSTTGLNYRNITFTNATDVKPYKEALEYINDEIFSLLKIMVDNDLSINNVNLYEYKNSEHFYISAILITPSFNEEQFFHSKYDKDYRTIFRFKKCIDYIEKEKLKNPNYKAYMLFLEYNNFHHVYDKNLYVNNTSPLIELRFYDLKAKKFIGITGCNGENNIIFYQPFTSYRYIDELNDQKLYYDPRFYVSRYDPIFTDPVFINATGEISHASVEERIKKYHRRWNFSCAYYDAETASFSEKDVGYMNFTKDTNYIQYNSSHLTKFTTFFIENNEQFKMKSRFFYLVRPQIFKRLQNYINSFGFLIFFSLLVLYFVLIYIYIKFDEKYMEKEVLIEDMKKNIVRASFPYVTDPGDMERLQKENIPSLKNKKNDKYKVSGFFDRQKDDKKFYGMDVQNNDAELNNEYQATAFNNDILHLKQSQKLTNDILNSEGKLESDDDEFDNIYTTLPKKYNIVKKRNNFFENIEKNPRTKDFGVGFRMDKKGHIEEDKDENTNAPDKKFKFTSFKIDKENPNRLPEVYENHEEEYNNRLREFSDLKLSVCQFFRINFVSRNLLINSFGNISLFHSRWKKVTFLLTECCLFSMVIALLLTSNANAKLNNKSVLILYILITYLLCNSFMYLFGYLFRFPRANIRRLFTVVKYGGDLAVDKEWRTFDQEQSRKITIGIICCSVFYLANLYISFGMTAVWYDQKYEYLACFVATFLLDFVVTDIFAELLVCFFYAFRHNHPNCVAVGEALNRMRNYRCLAP